jgi:AraC-like DNA-binding protein
MNALQVYEPNPALKSYVRYYWSLDLEVTSRNMLDLQLMADRFPRVVIQCLQGKSGLYGLHREELFPASVKGITSRPALVQMAPTYSHVAVSFFPHALHAMFGIDAYETIDAVLDLHHFFSHELTEQIMYARSHATRVVLLDNYLLSRLPEVRQTDWRILDFVRASQRLPYRDQLKEYGISERQFERKFLQAVGLTPSYYKRVLRFEKALSRILDGRFNSLGDLAYELGYADQSHFNREFKEMSSMSPLTLMTKVKITEESGSVVA